MADIKTLQTRIALKHDTWTAWHDDSKENQGANLVLLKGEIGFCEVPSVDEATTAPTVLFKVGDGTTPFKTLKWASALAADVYSWAKASDVVLEGKSIKFVKGAGENREVIKEIAIPYMTENDVKAITNPLTERLAAVEAKFGDGTDTVESMIAALDERLDVIEGTGDGSVAKALADAKAHAEAQDAALKTELQGYADQAEADAKAYADAEVLKDRNSIQALEEADAAQDLLIAGNTTAIGTEKTEREAADALINEKFGAEYNKDNTVATAIADAKKAGTDAAQAVVDLEAGQVTTNKNAIAANAEAIAANTAAITAEATARENADNQLSGRLDLIEAFFEAADHDGEEGGLNDALDTLVEIQNFLNGEGSAVDNMLDAIQANADAIDALEAVVGDVNGGLVKDMDAAEEAIGALEAAVETLEGTVAGYDATNTVKKAVDAAQAQADKGVADAATAQAAAEAAQGEVDALEGVVATLRSEYDVTAALATKNKEDIAALDGRMTTAEADIDALEAIVNAEGGNSNAQLRADIEALEAIVIDGADSNAALRTEVNRVAGLVDDTTTGLAATKVIADGAASKAQKNAEDISAIQGDYLKMADLFIIDCGSSTVNVHERPQA